jgi:acetyl esterase/lipase
VLGNENIEYAIHLMQADVPTELHVYPGAFLGFGMRVPTATISQRAASEYVAALKCGFRQ